MANFLKATQDDDTFIHGAARLLLAPAGTTFPTAIADIIYLAAVAGPPAHALYDPHYTSSSDGWVDAGATKNGITISRNNTEESFDVDQVQGNIATNPTGWTMSVATALAEMSLDRMVDAWELTAKTTNATPTPDEEVLNLGAPASYATRKLAVLFQRPSGLIRAFVFRKVQHTPQESSIAFNKTGDQQTLAVTFSCLADTSVALDSQFGVVYNQIAP